MLKEVRDRKPQRVCPGCGWWWERMVWLPSWSTFRVQSKKSNGILKEVFSVFASEMRGEAGGRTLTFLSTFYVSDSIPNTCRSITSHLVLSTLLVDSDFYPHFADEETDDIWNDLISLTKLIRLRSGFDSRSGSKVPYFFQLPWNFTQSINESSQQRVDFPSDFPCFSTLDCLG